MQIQHRRNETKNPKPRSTARTRRSKTVQEVGWANPFPCQRKSNSQKKQSETQRNWKTFEKNAQNKNEERKQWITLQPSLSLLLTLHFLKLSLSEILICKLYLKDFLSFSLSLSLFLSISLSLSPSLSFSLSLSKTSSTRDSLMKIIFLCGNCILLYMLITKRCFYYFFEIITLLKLWHLFFI